MTLVLLSLVLLATACGGDDDGDDSSSSDGVVITPLGTPAEASSASAEPTSEDATNGDATSATTEPGDATSPTTEPVADNPLSGFIFPIQGGCLPVGDQLMPNAPREYRNGTHEGVDLYAVDNCTPITVGTPVAAAKAGTVIRADLDYVDLTAERYATLAEDLTSADTLDAFRGRQVWIDHGNGIVTRYCHLSGIAPGIALGTQVNAGDVIAAVGESGTPESINNPGHEYHLHFEVRVGESFLGAGLPPAEVRGLYRELFEQ